MSYHLHKYKNESLQASIPWLKPNHWMEVYLYMPTFQKAKSKPNFISLTSQKNTRTNTHTAWTNFYFF